MQASHVKPCRDFILHKGIVQHSSVFVVLYILKKRHAYSLHNPAFGLHPRKVRIYDCSAVNHGGVIYNLNFTGQFVKLNFYGSCHKRRRRNRRAVAFRDFKRRNGTAHGCVCYLLKGNKPFVFYASYAFAVKV